MYSHSNKGCESTIEIFERINLKFKVTVERETPVMGLKSATSRKHENWMERVATDLQPEHRISVFRLFQNSGKNSKMWQLTTEHIIRKVEKAKIRGCSNVRIGLGELVDAQLVTLSYSPKFRSQMGINRSCIQHIALDNSPQHFTLLRGVQGGSPCRAVGVRPNGAQRQTAFCQAWGVRGTKPPFINTATSDSIYVLGATRNQEKGQYCQLSTYNSPNFSSLVIWPIREWSLNPRCPPPILRKIQTNTILGIWGPVRKFGKVRLLRFYLNIKCYLWHLINLFHSCIFIQLSFMA